MRMRARLLVLMLVVLGTALSGCSSPIWRRGRVHHRHAATPMAPAHATGERFDQNCCPFYELCVEHQRGASSLPPIFVCRDCECRDCRPIGNPDPCWRPDRPMVVRCVRIGNATLSCDCRCLSRVVIRVTPEGIFADLHPCPCPPVCPPGPHCLHHIQVHP